MPLSAFINFFNQLATNERNSEENAYNRRFAQQMAQQSRAWQLEDRAYNNPTAAIAREVAGYKANGLNPAMMMSSGVSGIGVQDSENVPDTSVPSSIPMQSGNLNLPSATDIIALENQSRQLDIEQQKVDIDYNRSLADIGEKAANTAKIVKETEKADTEIENIRANTVKLRSDVQRSYVQNACDLVQTINSMVLARDQHRLNEKSLEYYDRNALATLKKMRAETQSLLANKNYLNKQAQFIDAQRAYLKQNSYQEYIAFGAEYGFNPKDTVKIVKQKVQASYVQAKEAYENARWNQKPSVVRAKSILGMISGASGSVYSSTGSFNSTAGGLSLLRRIPK